MKWFKRTIVGSQHHEYRSEDSRIYYFDIEKHPSGWIRLYDLRENPAKYYLFNTLGEAKKIAIASIKDKTVLEPYLDHKWYKDSFACVEVIRQAEELIAKLKNQS